jgi:phospholipase C
MYSTIPLPSTERRSRIGLAAFAILQLTLGTTLFAQQTGDNNTNTPIKHVIVIIGENRTFDHVFATYPPRNGQTVWNLLSEGIINADGTPGPNFYEAMQNNAADSVRAPFRLTLCRLPSPAGPRIRMSPTIL